MKRSSLLFFALIMFYISLVPNAVHAQFVVNSARIILADNNGNGYANVGDSIIVEVTSNNTLGFPTVDLSAIGGNVAEIMIPTGNIYRTVSFPINYRATNPNYQLNSFTVSGNYDNDPDPAITTSVGNTQVTINATFFDQVQVNGGATATASRTGNTLTITITDSNYQALPNGGTVATVNLTPVGGNATTAMISNGLGAFSLTYTLPAGTDYNGPFTISLDDPVNVHPALTYQTNDLTIDNVYPTIDAANTNVTILSGNAVAIPGDILRLTARVTAYDNEQVIASAPDGTLTNPPALPAVSGGRPLNLITSSGPGNPAEWLLDIVLSSDDLKTGSLPVTFSFIDNAGNLSMITKNIAIDLDRPNILNSSATVILPDDNISPLSIATTSCKIQIISTITVDIQPDPNTVTVDLSAIGGPANYPMTQIGLSDQYKAVYNIPQGTLEDGASYVFIVSARDTGNNAVAQATTPAIRIDNNPPVLSGAQLTSPTANIVVGTVFTIQCNATGLENGSVSVNLSSIGLGAAENLPAVGGNVYRRTFTLLDSRAPGVPGIVDGYTSFNISANDTVTGTVLGHLVQATTNQLMIDNEPSTILASHRQYTHNVYPLDDNGFARILDTLSYHVRVASSPVSVRINMLSLGKSNSENMIASAAPTDGLSGWYDYILQDGVATGTVNRQVDMPFTVTVLDDADNATTTQILVNMDNKPVEVTGFNVNVTYRAGRTDTDASIINLNKSLYLQIPIAVPIPDDHAPTAVIDLSSIGGAAAAPMAYGNGSYSVTIDAAQTLYDSSGHRFQALIADLSGNRIAAQSSVYRVDCNPPTIAAATVDQLTGGAVAIVGDKLRFRTQLTNNENTVPTVDLSNIGGSATQAMTSTGGGWYEYTATIASGTIDQLSTTWQITAWDNDLNYAQSPTNAIDLDNFGPELNGGLTLLINGNPVTALSTINIGDTLDFTIDINNLAGTEGPATIDLRPVGGIASAVMTFNAGPTTYTLTHVTTATNAEYANYRFKAYVDDINVNRVMTQSSLIPTVDCQPVGFTSSGIIIWQDNGDNPVAGIVNIGDVLMVYASTSAYIDAIASATIGSGTADFATATMVFNSARNRHEALFTVKTPGVDGWGTLTGSTDQVFFKLSGIDDVSNLTQIAAQVSTFTVRNVAPEIDLINTHLTLSPNRYRDLIGITPVYNLGTDTVGDRLIASITFTNALPMHRAWLDFVELGSGTLEMTVSGNSAETSAAGVAVTRFANMDLIQKRVYLKAMDQAGNISVSSQSFWIDNIAPVLTSATFDGQKITANLSEEFFNLNYTKFELVGSNPPPLNTPAYLSFVSTAPAVLEDLTSFELTLTNDHMREIAQWASTPVYLKVTNVATSALTDLSGNELRPVNFFPVTITNSLWREPARITQFTMTHNWPASITLDLFFNKDIATASVIASNAVLLFSNLAYDFTSVDYTSGYVFQPEDFANFTWPLPNHLRIVMSSEGRDWLARKLGTGATQLRFATRSAAHVFVYDSLGKPMNHVPTSAPVFATDNRPTPGFDFSGPPNAPVLNLASRTLILTANDRLLLSSSNFDVLDINNPDMGMPVPTNNNRVSSFISKAVLHDIDSGANTTLVLQPIDIAINPLYASSTVTLKLTDDDLNRVINLFKANATPIWRMGIAGGAFTNLWGTANTAYLPSGSPGAMTLSTPSGYNPALIAACSMSDKPPVNQKLAGELVFDIEVFPPYIDGGVMVPVQSQIAPTARIVNQATNALISSGTFVNYSERTVSGALRSVFRFSNTSNFATNMQRVPSRIEISGITDIFGNTYSAVSSFAYDLNSRNDSAADGYTDTASAPIEIDTRKPQVTSVVPGDVIGRIPAGSNFKVNFDETMDPTITPVLRLATGTTLMNFTFAGWTATATADFTNDTAFTATLPNGTWYYQVTSARDAAGNNHDGTAANAFPVQVRTYAPEVQPGNITLRTIQSTISADVLTAQPWASLIGNGIFSIQYDAPPTQFLPHFLEIFDPSTNTRLGRATIVSNLLTNMATATFADTDFYPAVYPGLTGPTTFATRIIDSTMNQTETLTSIVYDNLVPDVATFDLAGIGSSTATTWYYRQTSGNFTANVVTTSTTDNLRLAIYSYATGATSTIVLNTGVIPGTYNVATGTGMTNGTYTLTIVDMAGNIGSGASSKRLIADNTAANVVSILPSDAIGNSPAGLTQVRAVYSEAMDASAAQNPTLEIATAGFTIPMTFTGWVDPLVASTALFVNTNNITAALPAGTYTYRLSGGRDLAGNTTTPTVDGTHQVVVYSQGPFARVDALVDQRHIYGPASGLQTNFAFNPAYAANIATLTIDYAGGPFNPPHDLQVYKADGTQVGTYTALPAADPAAIQFPGAGYVWSEAPGAATNETYQFKIVDSALNVSGGFLPNSLRYDTTTPNVTSISVSLPGIATDTGIGLAWYYSPAQGNATFTVITSNNDIMRLLVLTPTATAATTMTSSNNLTHRAVFGSTLTSGSAYAITAVDTAGNLAAGPASYALLIADSDAPSVIAATPLIAGSLAAGAGTFDVTFDEFMNTGVVPTMQLASGTTTIAMNYVSWLSTDTVRFTNAVTIDSTFPVGSYSYIVSAAKDLAGNPSIVTNAGQFEVQLFTTAPSFTARLVTRQTELSGTTDLINRPFSANVDPGVATISLTYASGHPYQAPHSILIYRSDKTLVSTTSFNPSVNTDVSVDYVMLGSPAATESYSIRLLDSIGNLSATYTIPILYDQIQPTISSATVSNVSSAVTSPLYYNEQLHGSLLTRFTTNASDPLVLVISGITPTATATFDMSSNTSTGISSFSVPVSAAATLAAGRYWITAADMAGNKADGAASTTLLVIDRTAPVVNAINTPSGLALSSNPTGSTTITIDFNEPMNQLASANPALVLATTTRQIAFTFKSWLDADTAEFVNAEPVTIDVPQGDYNARVTAWDLTGNKHDAAPMNIAVRSRGPVVASFSTRSYQATTASGPAEILINRPFSMNVAPGAATLSIRLSKAPDSLPVHLHFTLEGQTVASTPLSLDAGLNATFTWNISTGPIPLPAQPTTYLIRLADNNGDLSLESHSWRVDNVRPSVQEPVISGGANNTASATVYFNPALHTFVNVRFNAVENESPMLRIRGTNSTDTYILANSGTNMWSGNFEGRFSRGTAPLPPMPDGRYAIDMVDQAGNVALLASGAPVLYDVVIDTQAPVVATYVTLLSGNKVSTFAPAAGNLIIEAISTETLSATGIYWLEVLNSSGVKIRTLALQQVNPMIGSFTAAWDGKDSNGSTVIDGYYKFRATDYAGNKGTESANVFARTSPFKVSGITQISSTTAKIWFNHEIDAASVVGSPVVSVPALTISNLTRSDSQAVSFTVNPAFSHETSYTFTVNPATIRSIFGAATAAPDNTAVLVADGQGPKISGVNFSGLTGQQEFKVEFNEAFKATTAGIAGNYILTGTTGAINIIQATTQSDLKTVVLTAATSLIENADYQIAVTGVEDSFGNLSPVPNTYSFKGRDLTPPVLQVSAFSNPANENDIIVVVTANELLKASPDLQIAQSNAPVITTLMQQGAEPKSFMIGVHLSPSYPGNGTLIAYGVDLAGNQGTANNTFTIAYVSSTAASQIISADQRLKLSFNEDSLKEDATVKILQHELSKDNTTSASIRTSLQNQLRAATGQVRASVSNDAEQQNHAELIPVSDAYEIGIASEKVSNGFVVHLAAPQATSTAGLGLFYQSGNIWKFVSSNLSSEQTFEAKTSSSQIFAIMRDIEAPRVNMAADLDLNEPFRTARPEFSGNLKESGSGLDQSSVCAYVDGGPAQPVQIDSEGNFVFKPLADMVGGSHDLVISASDRTGNQTQMAALRFAVEVPLSIGQIMQYPNPANRRGYIRISANRGDLNDDLVKIRIYDVAGHKVTSLEGVRAVKENWGVNSRFLYDIPWDLRNENGKNVANGVYFAKIEVRDPTNPSARIKKNFKLAVLR